MKRIFIILLVMCVPVFARNLKSGPQVGKNVDSFKVIKVDGPKDGVKTGKSVCYRTHYKGKPTIIIFSRTADSSLASLVKGIDVVVTKNAKLHAFVVFVGKNDKEVTEMAKNFAKKYPSKSIPVTVSLETPVGPKNLDLHKDAEHTVVMYKHHSRGGVRVNYALKAGQLTRNTVRDIVQDTQKILK